MSLDTSGSHSGGQQPTVNEAFVDTDLLTNHHNTNSSEMVLQMLDTLVTAQEPFYPDYPTYQQPEAVSHHHQIHHQLTRSSIMPPGPLDATTHTPGWEPVIKSIFFSFSTAVLEMPFIGPQSFASQFRGPKYSR